MDILQSTGVNLFADSPSRLIPYMNHRGFTDQEISCLSKMAETEPKSLSEIIVSEDEASLLNAVSKLSKTFKSDCKICASLIEDLRKASDMYFGRPQLVDSLFDVKSIKAVKDRYGTLVTKDFIFSPVENGVALEKYQGSRSAVVIPDNVLYEGFAHPVVAIAGWAFEGLSFITSVSLPYSLTSIGDRAFADCSELKFIEIPSGVSKIAFDAFDGCDSLQAFSVDVANGHFASDSQGLLFSIERKSVVMAPATIEGDVVIPDQVVAIDESAFYDCSNLKSIVARGSLETIGSWAFEGCTSLESVALGSNLKLIDSGAFFGCRSLKKLDIPDGVRIIESRALSGCTSLREISLPGTLSTIGKWAFEGCASLEEILIPGSVSKLGQGFFYGCDSLRRIDVDFSNPSFNSDEFGILYDRKRCVMLRAPRAISGRLSVRDGTAIINERGFEGCRDIEHLELPESVSLIGRRAFAGCSGLKALAIPPMVKSIPDGAFAGCTSLESVTIPEGVAKIGCGTFSDCPSLKEVRLPKSATSIGYGAFDEGVRIIRE